MKTKEWIILIAVIVIVAVIASLITANITGNIVGVSVPSREVRTCINNCRAEKACSSLKGVERTTCFAECNAKCPYKAEIYTKAEIDNKGYFVDGCNQLDTILIKNMRVIEGDAYTNKTWRGRLERKVIKTEGEQAYRSDYVVVPGAILKVSEIHNSSYGYYEDVIELMDISTSNMYRATITTEGGGVVVVNGITYSLTYNGESYISEEERYITLNFPQTAGNTKMSFNC